MIAERFGISSQGRAADKWLAEVVRWTWKVKLYTHLETDLLGELREAAESEAINVFARNLHDLLLAAPAGPRSVHGARPRPAHRLQGGRGRRHRQAARYRHRLPARATQRLGRQPARPSASCAPSTASS